jgi:Tfp pilus assembly protein PilX
MISMFVLIILSLLGAVLLTLSGTEHTVAFNAIWSEGAFAAAEAGVQRGLNQLSSNPTTSVKAIPQSGSYLTIGSGYQYRSGRKTDTSPQPLSFKGSRVEPGYSIAIGTGYNPSGYVFQSYQINATGTGPRSSQRELEILAEYGPVAQ